MSPELTLSRNMSQPISQLRDDDDTVQYASISIVHTTYQEGRIFTESATVENKYELCASICVIGGLERMRDAWWEVPQIAFDDCRDEVLSISIDRGDLHRSRKDICPLRGVSEITHGSRQNKKPYLRSLMPVKFAYSSRFQSHVDTSHFGGNGHHAD